MFAYLSRAYDHLMCALRLDARYDILKTQTQFLPALKFRKWNAHTFSTHMRRLAAVSTLTTTFWPFSYCPCVRNGAENFAKSLLAAVPKLDFERPHAHTFPAVSIILKTPNFREVQPNELHFVQYARTRAVPYVHTAQSDTTHQKPAKRLARVDK